MFKSLTHFQKFQPGSQLWMIFFEPKRYLFKQINWRTAFLLQSFREQKAISQPVLIDTHSIFPNNSLLCLPLKKESWLSDIYNCWRQLNKPSFRVFIPEDYDEQQLNQLWPQSDLSYNLSYYKEMKK